MQKYIWVTILFLLVLTACESGEKNNQQEQASLNKSEPTSTNQSIESNEQIPSLENKLVPPKFIITHFDVDYLKEQKELVFYLNYEIDSEIYEILTKSNQEIHFILEYPENLVDTLNQSHSDAIIAEKPSDYNTKFQVVFSKEVELTENDMEKIEENISGFNLLIADIEQDIISQFIDLYAYNNYDPEQSNNSSVD